jgi:hypothetical protein
LQYVDAQAQISVKTESPVYFSNDPIKVSGSVFNTSGFPVKNGTVTIKVFGINSTQIVYNTSVPMSNGYFNTSDLSLAGDDANGILQLMLGGWGEMSKLFGQRYNLTATALVDGKTGSTAWTQLEIKGYFTTPSAMMLYGGLINLILFIIVISLPSAGKGNWLLIKRILIFLFISGIALSPIASIFTVDSEVGINSPIGLLKKDDNSNLGAITSQWVINMGGTTVDNIITGGVQIPVYIFIFGIAGGYVRYLYDIASKWKEEFEDNSIVDESKDKNGKDKFGNGNPDIQLFFHSLEHLAIIFLSPLLAVAIWFILFQGGTTSNFTLAAIAITVGLLMKDIITKITDFSKNIVGGPKTKKQEEQVKEIEITKKIEEKEKEEKSGR